MTATDLAVRDPQATAIPAKIAYARALAESGLLPGQYRKQPANILWAAEYGEMLGLSTMAAITGVHVIDGKPGASAGLISALVRRAGHKLHVRGNGKSATCRIIRSDDPGNPFEVTWTLRKNADDNPSAEEAGLLSKPTWKQYPAAMLKARAITQCARDACEEALFGLHYTPEELGAEVDEDGVVVDDTPGTAGNQPRGRGTVFIDPDCLVENEESRLADRSGGTPEDDQWYVRPDPDADPPWAEHAIEQAAAVPSKRAGDKLWREAAAKARAGEISGEDAACIQELLTGRYEDLRQQAFQTAMSHLSENEPWRAKIEELASDEDARNALNELHGLVTAGTIDARREQRISRAIVAKYPRATDTDPEVAA